MSFSKRLIHLRSVKGMSQEELASLLNITRQSVSKWESEQSMPESDKIIHLSEIFGVTTDYLLKGVETDSSNISLNQNSKVGADMAAEVFEILDHVHKMSRAKRMLIGLGMTATIIIVIVLLIAFAKM